MSESAAGSIYERIGGVETINKVVDSFYRHMSLLPQAQTIRAMHGDGLIAMKSVLKKYLTEQTGGPDLYSSEKGHPPMLQRHQAFPIDNYAADVWMECMDLALSEHVADADVRTQLHAKIRSLADMMRNTK
ncbi:hemoglobin [Rhodoblastus acidophilus]|uniref:group II truncated hemoglobin n=1 Tax=Rhodoblastus acidophilus TaxID=1074 RepID=UPI00161E3138|nr:group II truncated hemoglobin [Rhodoblastus acidophilus]MCW2285270.1 hemoglobin [Rhodoblastus acidophilus]MCW2334226.1 hemoglobin [Rhodoblastus acidophilus]